MTKKKAAPKRRLQRVGFPDTLGAGAAAAPAPNFWQENHSLAPSSQKATALAAATLRESTPWDMGMRTV